MNGHAASRHSLRHEESAVLLLDEKSLSDIESDAGRADLESRFITNQQKRWLVHIQIYMSTLRPPTTTCLKRVGIFLLPSFVQSRFFSNHHRDRNRDLGPTAYLDGMRGLAALFVFFCHYFYTCFIIAQGWGYGADNYHVLKLPFLRLFYQGPPMVCVFFVISGYALSLKPLKLARQRKFDSLATTMASFIFRRGFRLFLPTAISTLMIVAMLRVGLYEWTREFAYDDRYMKNVQEIHYDRLNSTAEQLEDWGKEMFRFVHVWDWDSKAGSTAIDVHLWTIPVEFRSSMMLFLTLLGTARLKTRLRLLGVALIMCFVYCNDRWELLLFYWGMVLAELDLIRGVHNSSDGGAPIVAAAGSSPVSASSSSSSAAAAAAAEEEQAPADIILLTPKRSGKIKRAMWLSVSILALYLMSQPDQGGEETPGWVVLTNFVPEWYEDTYRYWQSVGAVLLVLAVGRSPGWQRFFNTGVVQYFGKISYAIYLMHGPVMHTVGYAIERWIWMSVTGTEGTAYNWGFVLASLFVVPVVVWASDVFWRAVDAPVVRFAKWLEVQCSIAD
ncbi:acyltransferase [Apodospora peruviana]|uniref:Acyltransferase n=1 Tax=Apodospora peruviana TaxID=516989 RepID=A0AAE0IHZ9_9PEZI|nr:acyltransferase [Apodospora peruviana]